MADRQDQIQQVLKVLASHGDLVAEGLDGSVEMGDKTRNKAIDALVSIHALTPYEEGAYRLNPRLREYITDHLVSYGAFQSLTRLNPLISRTRMLWQNLNELRNAGELKDAEKLEWAIDDTVTEIVYAVEHNLLLLHSQISTEYGNVSSIKAKLAQNRHYGKEVRISLAEMRQVDTTASDIENESLTAGNLHVRHLINSRLRSRLAHWVAKLNDIQAVISKRLFLARKMEQRLVNLAKAALWLSQNKTSSGFDINVDPNCPVELVRPDSIRIRPHIDVRDTDPVVWDAIVAAVNRMPAKGEGRAEKKQPEMQLVRSVETALVMDELDPVDEMIDQVADVLYGRSTTVISLIQWKQNHKELAQVSDEEWLVFAATQLGTHGFKTEFAMAPRQASIHNDLFEDVMVYALA